MAKSIYGQTPMHDPTQITIDYAQNERQYRVLRHGTPIKTPQKRDILLPSQTLAQAVAHEWRRQSDKIKPTEMPLTALINTAIDYTATNRDAVLETLIAHANHDLLCYLVDHPEELANRQQSAWQPIRDWVQNTHAIELKTTFGITPITQPANTLAHLRSVVAPYHDMALTALGVMVSGTGSLLLGLCLAQNHIDDQTAFDLSQLEETYQIEQWGQNPQIDARRQAIAEDIKQAASFLRLCRSDDIG